MTLEDPVEYPFPMIRQTSVSEAAGMDFASGIKSLMRQDPDIILVGEVRDKATAEMAFRAAMTGHQVFTTLHSNSAVGALPRLKDIGVTSEILSGNVIGIIAQRLVRKLCKYCKKPYAPSETDLQLLSNRDGVRPTKIYKAKGCKACDNSGYKGRVGLYEIMRMDRDIAEAVLAGKNEAEIEDVAVKKGMILLQQDGCIKAMQGHTTLEEIFRVTRSY